MGKKLLFNQQGLTLVNAIVAVGILSIVTLLFATLMKMQGEGTRHFSQRDEMLELKNLLIQKFSNQSICSFHLKNTVINAAGATPTHPSATIVHIQKLYEGSDSTTAAFAEVGALLQGTQYGLVVDSITLREITSTGTADEYRGKIAITFNPSSVVRTSQPVSVQVRFRTDPASPVIGKVITTCLPPQDIITKFAVPLGTLALYHDGVANIVTRCAALTESLPQGRDLVQLMSACNRYCSSGCNPSALNCTGVLPGQGFSGGSVGEIDCATALCTCM